MKQITRGIIGWAGALCAGTTIGTVGGVAIKKAAETYCKTKGGQLALYSVGSVGFLIIMRPVLENVATRITNWVFKEEDEKWQNERIKAYKELLKKQEEEL